MCVLIIGNRERYERYMPKDGYVQSLKKTYVPLGTPVSEILQAGKDAKVLMADAVAEVPADLIRDMPNLKLIQSEGVAYNGIDVAAATEAGVYVCNNQGMNAPAVAEQTVLLMLGLLHHVLDGDLAVRSGRQIQKKEILMVDGIPELADRTVGLVGFGDTGRAVAARLIPFGCKTYYYARHRTDESVEKALHAEYISLQEMRKKCDVISLHVPVTGETKNMVNRVFLQEMREDALLINTSRGELVNNEALAEALEQGWIAGAGLDTVAPEPVPKDHVLLNVAPQVQAKLLFSPHIAGVTRSSFLRGHRMMWENCERVLEGRKPERIVNP